MDIVSECVNMKIYVNFVDENEGRNRKKKAKFFYIIFETLHESIHYSEEKPYSYGLLSAL